MNIFGKMDFFLPNVDSISKDNSIPKSDDNIWLRHDVSISVQNDIQNLEKVQQAKELKHLLYLGCLNGVTLV